MITTPNMGLVLPDEGGSSGVWAVLLDAIFSAKIDSHTHEPGKGVLVPVAGMNFNANVPIGGFGLTGVGQVAFSQVAALAAGSTVLFVNSTDHELYWRTASGANVKLTAATALNVAAFVGGIGGDYAAASALFSFDDATDSYWAQQQGSPRPWARLRVGDVDIYETAASISNRVRLKSPAALAASYALTFPAAVPGSTQLVQVTSAGQFSFTNTIVEALTVAANKNLTLSGTGRNINAGNLVTVPLFPTGIVTGGTSAWDTATPGAVQSASTTAYYNLGPSAHFEKVTSVTTFAKTSANNTTYSLVLGGGSGTPIPFSGDIAGTPTTTTADNAVLTPSVPAILSDGLSLYLKVVTAAGSTRQLTAAAIAYDMT